MYNSAMSHRSIERAPSKPQRRKSLNTHSSLDEEDEFDLNVLVHVQLRSKRESTDYMVSPDSYSFLSCSMASLQIDGLIDVGNSGSNQQDSMNFSHTKLDLPIPPKEAHAPRRRGCLRRTKGIMMPSPTQRSPRRLMRSDAHHSIRMLEL